MSQITRAITKFIKLFYIHPIKKFIPIQTFLYAACGGGNLLLNWIIYGTLYNFVLQKEMIDLGFIVISAHIAAFIISFPITFLTGFWLQRNVTFTESNLKEKTQLIRYLLCVTGSVILNYIGLKLFVEILHLYPTPSQIITSLLTVIYSYIVQKHFTFVVVRRRTGGEASRLK